MAKRGPNISKEVQLSKAMTFLLRHGAEKEGIQMNVDGFVNLDELLQHKSLKTATKDEILKIVENCPKKRFFVKTEIDPNNQKEQILIRANQGHSIKDLNVDMEEIINSNEIKIVIHGTYHRFWDQIKNQGLSRMSRQHIHFSTDMPGSKDVISGMRSNCQIAIYVDVEKALHDGLKFYKSANNVILCPGDASGYLSSKYFLKAIDLQKNTDLLEN
ncbi:unnamed protein product [Brachionus calyciflorus]|uniref:2'-phosphotransferase n=1 Tax=Brachionus calyciflorus TaxID=104777 RepID=A0A813NRD2_9BILA|nr:unnamed protein product [Brachionus calyciflorus]